MIYVVRQQQLYLVKSDRICIDSLWVNNNIISKDNEKRKMPEDW